MTVNSHNQDDDEFCIKWEGRLHIIETQLKMGIPFPEQDFFYDSVWNIWKERIENGHRSEENQIQKIYKEWKEMEPKVNDPSFDQDGWASDEFWQACKVTNAMYAALVVSIWSEMEGFLKKVFSICSEADRKEETSRKPYEFDKIEKALKVIGIEIMNCDAAHSVNAVRILNNSFKHDDGRYRPDNNKPYSQIEPRLLSKWNILKNHNGDEIDYSKLPIQEIIQDCNSFCMDLINKTKAALQNKTR